MASIYKRKNEDGTSVWRAVIRIKGYPAVSKSFSRKQEAEDWARATEHEIKFGSFKFEQHKKKHTFAELVDRLIQDGALEHHRSQKDTRLHLAHWKTQLGSYALVHITPELISKERQLFLEKPKSDGSKRTPATVNRFFATLSLSFTYAVKQLRWVNENPCLNLKKLKEGPGRDRVLSEDEMSRLLSACRESKSPYLFCFVLIAISTGARRGEILNLEWRYVDFENKIAFIKETKNGRPRSIPLCDPVIDELKRLYENRNPQKSLVFASKTAFGRIDIKKSWQIALKRAGIVNFRIHDLRHSFCTFAAAGGASNLQLATATGHRTLQMLLRYTNLDAESIRHLSEGIANKLKRDHEFS